MTTSQADLDAFIHAVLNRISGLSQPQIRRLPTSDVLQWVSSRTWPDWAALPGLYFFELDDSLQYVGRALRSALRGRLSTQCKSLQDPEWKKVVLNPRTSVGAVALPQVDWFWTAALEAAVIVKFQPRFSSRI